MGREEDTILFFRSDRLGNSVELLYTAYLPMLMSSAQLFYLQAYWRDELTSRGDWVSWLVAAMTILRSSFRKIAAPKTLFPPATPIAVRGMMPCSIVVKNVETSFEGSCPPGILSAAMLKSKRVK